MKIRCILYLFMTLLLFQLLCSCQNRKSPPDTLDHSLYDESRVVYSDKRSMINAPGMVLFMSQGAVNLNGKIMGSRLTYLNKKKLNSNIFCYDTLCTHDDCLAKTFHMAEQIVYNSSSDALYAVKPEKDLAGAGTEVYRLDLQASTAKKVFEGNGNEIKYLTSYKQYIFILRQLTDGGYEVIRYDTKTNQNKVMTLPNNKKAVELIISDDNFYILFADDIFYYKTDKEFSQFVKLEHFTTATTWSFIIENTAYAVSADNLELYATQNNSELIKLDLSTGERKTIFKPVNGYFRPLGLDENLNFYYCTTDASEIIYRRNLTNGTTILISDLSNINNVERINDVYLYDAGIYVYCTDLNGYGVFVYLNPTGDNTYAPIIADPSVS